MSEATIKNYSTAILLVNPAVKVVMCSYETTVENGKKVGKHPFTPWKTMDATLQVGDLVVVPSGTRWDRTVVRVEEINVELDIDYPNQVGWIVAPLDDTDFKATLAMESRGIETIKSAEKRARQEALKAKLLADNPALAELGGIGAPPPLPAPEPSPAPMEDLPIERPPSAGAYDLNDQF